MLQKRPLSISAPENKKKCLKPVFGRGSHECYQNSLQAAIIDIMTVGEFSGTRTKEAASFFQVLDVGRVFQLGHLRTGLAANEIPDQFFPNQKSNIKPRGHKCSQFLIAFLLHGFFLTGTPKPVIVSGEDDWFDK